MFDSVTLTQNVLVAARGRVIRVVGIRVGNDRRDLVGERAVGLLGRPGNQAAGIVNGHPRRSHEQPVADGGRMDVRLGSASEYWNGVNSATL